MPFEGMVTGFVEQLFELGKDKKAEKIGLQIIENYSQKEKLTERDFSNINYLKNISNSYQNKVLQKAFEKTNW